MLGCAEHLIIFWFKNTMYRFSSTLLGFCLALILPQYAQAVQSSEDCHPSAYLISSVEVDAEGTTGTQARRTGIDEATSTAFSQLVERMVLPQQDRTALNQIAVDRMVDFIRISAENALPRRYIAELDICFDATRIRAAFLEAGLEWAELVSPPVLLLPVWQEPAGIRVWARNISWLDGWRQFRTDDNSLVKFTMLNPDLELERQLSAQEIAVQNSQTLKKAAKEAGALQLAWIYAGLDYSGAVPELVLQASLFDADGNHLGELISERQKLDGALNMQAGFDLFRARILSEIDHRWQMSNRYQLAEQNEIIITAEIADLQGWQNIQRVLRVQNSVNSLMPVSLSTSQAVLRAQLSAPVESLQLSIKSLGFVLDATEEGYVMRADVQ